LDTPPQELLSALMSLLSHDEYEAEYDYVDTHNGIVTKSNGLRGWPAVIFAQAIDYSHYKRYPEIQRRFITTNPRMDMKLQLIFPPIYLGFLTICIRPKYWKVRILKNAGS
jgi:hypothetical protein